jgi:hypothetical protein
VSALYEYKILKKLGKLNTRLDTIQIQLTRMENNMSVELDNLTVEVTEMGTVVDSAITLLNGLSAQLLAIKDDPAKIAALALELDTKANELALAVTANTPAA